MLFDLNNAGLTPDDISSAHGRFEIWASVDGHLAGGAITMEGVEVHDPLALPPRTLAHWAAYPEVAGHLLADAYKTIVRGEPFLIVADSSINSMWVRFLWLALPAQWASRIPFLSFTRSPLDWSKDGCGMIAGIPEDAVRDIWSVRRTAVIVSLDASDWATEPEEPFARYSRHVVQVLQEESSRLDELRRLISRFMTGFSAPTPAEIEGLRIAVALVRRGPLQLPPEGLPLPASMLLEEDDLPLLEPQDLVQVLRGRGLDPHWQKLILYELEHRPGDPNLAAVDWDAWLAADASPAMCAMLAAGQWESWRTQTKANSLLLRQAGLLWCMCDYWQSLEREPFLEHWKQVVKDIGSLDPSQRFDYPAIAWFEDEQADDVRQLRRIPEPITNLATKPRAVPPPLPVASIPPESPAKSGVKSFWSRFGKKNADN